MTSTDLALQLEEVSDHVARLEASDTAYDVDGAHPGILCQPDTAEEVAAILGVAHREKASVIPRGGGTRMSVGFAPRQADIVLLTSALDGVVEYEPADLTVTVQAGMRFGALQDMLREHGQMLGLDPFASGLATIGGVVSSNASGPMRQRYGTARDLVIGVRVANAEGMLTKAGGRVVKNVSGYDLNKLYTGSFGTLGIIVELSFKLHPLPPCFGTVLAVFDSPARAQAAVQKLVKSPLDPAALTIVGASASADLLSRKVPSGGAALLVLAAGFENAVARQTRDIVALFDDALASQILDGSDGERAWSEIRRFPELTDARDDVVLKLSVPPASSASMMESMDALGRAEGAEVQSVAQAGAGVIHTRVLGANAAVERIVNEGRAAAVALRGSLVVERCPTELKSRIDVWGEVGSSFRIMAALKERFDPHGILNPGRFVGHL